MTPACQMRRRQHSIGDRDRMAPDLTTIVNVAPRATLPAHPVLHVSGIPAIL
jgi:hypothetical protein